MRRLSRGERVRVALMVAALVLAAVLFVWSGVARYPGGQQCAHVAGWREAQGCA